MHMSRKCLRLSRDWIYLLQNSFSSNVYLMHIYKTLNGFGKSICMGIKNFVKSVILMSLHKEKIEIIKACILLLMWGKLSGGGGSQKS